MYVLAKQRGDGFTELEERYSKYEVYDRTGEKIGKVDDLFVDEHDNPEYIGVKMGFLGMRSTLIPMEAARVDEARHRIEVSAEKAEVKEGPAFSDDEEITPEYEERVRVHYGLQSVRGSGEHRTYGGYYGGTPEVERPGIERGGSGVADFGMRMGDREEGGRFREHPPGEKRTYAERGEGTEGHSGVAMSGLDRERGEAERRGEEHPGREREGSGAAGPGMRMGDREEGGRFRQHPPGQEGVTEREDDLQDEDELRVQRSEEELRAGTREREAGAMRVRKRVRTEREQIRVPKRREEVHVERVPVEGREAPEAEIGEDEVVMPVTEEETVVEKRPVVKEEIRLHKDAVQDEEVVEEDVRKEEVDIDDQTEHRGALGREASRRRDV